ncbi:MAG: class I SAM-dependent methyltransferase [Rhodospirillales bacterium]|jgi:2-polyprenyl-3-methyl-5-hydroxy-6-metoxy-1,4-benzoquinol methylase|nr:class I SAM-dependent methyltransferase [Rhodospirillales bacterium]
MSFYNTYNTFKGYSTPIVGPKHMRRMDAEIWRPGAYSTDMAIVELGCGTGLVLAYLNAKNVADITGVDHDPALADVVPEQVRASFRVTGIDDFLNAAITAGDTYDRVIAFDVLEHFSPEQGHELLVRIAKILKPDGRIHLKVPNAGSPWGQQFQYGDLTHQTAFTPGSLRQLAISAGYVCINTYPQPLGSPTRRALSGLLHRLLNTILPTPPEIWDGNFYAVLERRPPK